MKRDELYDKLMDVITSPNEHPTIELGNTILNDAARFVHGEYYHHRIEPDEELGYDYCEPLFECGVWAVDVARIQPTGDGVVTNLLAHVYYQLVAWTLDITRGV